MTGPAEHVGWRDMATSRRIPCDARSMQQELIID